MNPWDDRYIQYGNAFGLEPNDFLVEQVAALPSGGRVCCLCEGQGRNAVWLAKQGFSVHAIDASEVALTRAKALADEAGVRITTRVVDLGQVSWQPDAWDGVVSIFAHVPPAVRQRVHRTLATTLKPGGVLILEAYTPDQLHTTGRGGPPLTERQLFMSLEELRSELQGLEMELGHELIRRVDEGVLHRGEGAVVQVVARRGS